MLTDQISTYPVINAFEVFIGHVTKIFFWNLYGHQFFAFLSKSIEARVGISYIRMISKDYPITP